MKITNLRSLKRCLAGSAFLAATSVAYADVGCRADLSYVWKKQGASEELEVLYKTVEAIGPTEELTRQELGQLLARERPKAIEECRERHENVTGCVGTRFAQHQSTMTNMPFTARKALEEAIKGDCQALAGSCGLAKTSEIACAQRVSAATPTPAADAGKDEKGKEKESKKK